MVVVCVEMILVGDSVFCWSVGCGVREIVCVGWWCGWSKPGDLGRVMWCYLWMMGVGVDDGMVVVCGRLPAHAFIRHMAIVTIKMQWEMLRPLYAAAAIGN